MTLVSPPMNRREFLAAGLGGRAVRLSCGRLPVVAAREPIALVTADPRRTSRWCRSGRARGPRVKTIEGPRSIQSAQGRWRSSATAPRERCRCSRAAAASAPGAARLRPAALRPLPSRRPARVHDRLRHRRARGRRPRAGEGDPPSRGRSGRAPRDARPGRAAAVVSLGSSAAAISRRRRRRSAPAAAAAPRAPAVPRPRRRLLAERRAACGSRRAASRRAIYDADGRGPLRRLGADAAPQHVTFGPSSAYVASGEGAPCASTR